MSLSTSEKLEILKRGVEEIIPEKGLEKKCNIYVTYVLSVKFIILYLNHRNKDKSCYF